jgi:hypothetical protein
MAFDWREFLNLARWLKDQASANAGFSTEAAYRCAMGRAYYAAFGHAHRYARTWLNFLGKTRPEDKSQEHGALRAFLKSKRRAKVAEKLNQLRYWRNQSDYEEDLQGFDFPTELDAALQAAEYVFQSLVPPKDA